MRAIQTFATTLALSLAMVASSWAQQALPAGINPDSLSRVPALYRTDMKAEDVAIYDKVAGADRTTPMYGPGGISLHIPEVARAMDMLNQYLRYESVIGRRYIEVAILEAAREFDQQYEYSAHQVTAIELGVPANVIDAINLNQPAAGLPEKDQAIILYGREILRGHKLSQSTWDLAVSQFGQQGALEIAAIMGDYLLAAVLLHAVDQQLPPDRPAVMAE